MARPNPLMARRFSTFSRLASAVADPVDGKTDSSDSHQFLAIIIRTGSNDLLASIHLRASHLIGRYSPGKPLIWLACVSLALNRWRYNWHWGCCGVQHHCYWALMVLHM